MSFVRTILGDISPDDLGVCYAHEHIVIDESFPTRRYPEFLLNDSDRIVEELVRFREAGGNAMIDSMPCDCGRNAARQAEVSEGAGIHIVVPTGMHLSKYYEEGHWSGRYSADTLSELMVADIGVGIDRWDYSGPKIDRLENRAGLIKVASDLAFTPREERTFEAAAKAHLETGAPILTHTEQGELGLEQVKRFQSYGVDLRKVTLSHLDRKPDLAYHREILASGVKVEYDSAFRWKTEDNPTLELVLGLYPEFPEQIMLGMDAARRSYWRSFGGEPGLDYLLRVFVPLLKERGFSDGDIRRIFVETPKDSYSFVA